jgi:hypothetical protein
MTTRSKSRFDRLIAEAVQEIGAEPVTECVRAQRARWVGRFRQAGARSWGVMWNRSCTDAFMNARRLSNDTASLA